MIIRSTRLREFDQLAARILANKARYQTIESKTGVPWHLIAILHLRESNADFSTYLGNGQSLHHVTTIVPKGRGPFNSFEDGAVDALKLDGLTSINDWCLEKELYYCEIFNGAGYDARGLPSPYVFGGTSIQKPGKYISDHGFDPRVWDMQPGCAPILATLAKHDSSIQLIRES
jgi:lysozyme family protein